MRGFVCLITLAVVCAAANPARADTDTIVVGPAASGTVAAGYLKQIKTLLLRGSIGTAVDRKIDAACAADLACLVTAGTELSAKRVLAVTVAQAGKGQLTVGLSLVDVIGKEMVAVHDVPVAEKRIGKDLVPAIKKFLEDAPTDRAKALYAEGNEHFNLNEMQQALDLYKRAYRIKPLPAFLFNIAQCQRKLGHAQEAINMYQAYLVGVPDASNKAMVESLINESRQMIADEQKREQQKAALAADVEKKKLDAARKVGEAQAAAQAEQSRAEQARVAHEKATYNTHPIRKWVIVSSLLAAGAIGGGSYFGVQSHKQQQKFDAQFCGDGSKSLDSGQLATCASERKTGERDALLSNSLIIGGAAALVGSIVLFAIDPGNVSNPETPRAALRIAPTSIHLVLTW